MPSQNATPPIDFPVNMGNEHDFHRNRIKLSTYNIVGIPRVLLIDKDFKIVEMSAPLPSQAGAIKAINDLL
ncbi:hypothetical protein FBD94_21015 [Pedobacter hiemivivus]|uniref:Redoxin domain-containing protein n=1 Tax=Pedobacter hiemivivus TaxID=2530454 RepID=A0A4V5PBV1_9SPHI|nr:hypothetical protein [Pedobacter hiemivivus]TKC57116.1 hypothetical protein FBD94_21015 [Pedobacter hiemivivus]